MNDSISANTVVDEEFRLLVQPYETETMRILEEDLKTNGCREKLAVWRGILLADFQIHEICLKHSIPYETEEKSFRNKYHALSWLCSNQLERSDLTEEYRKYLMGKKFEYEMIINHEPKTQPHEGQRLSPAIQKRKDKYKVSKAVAVDLHIASPTVLKYGNYASAIDRIRRIRPDYAERILKGALKMSHESTVKLAEQSDGIITKVMEKAKADQMDHIIYSELTNEFQFRTVNGPGKKQTDSEEPLIKQMPEHDPDAEINSLSLTIPSWVSSMENAHRRTDFLKTSPAARISLIKQFGILERTINVIQTEIEGLL